MRQNALFIGYCDLEEWAQAVEYSRPVMAIAFQKQRQATTQYAGPEIVTLGVEVAQHDDDGHVHYCHIISTEFNAMFGEVHSEPAQHAKEAGSQHQQMILDWLSERGFTVRTGSYSRATDWTTTIGHADCVARYEPEQRRYVRVNGEDENP